MRNKTFKANNLDTGMTFRMGGHDCTIVAVGWTANKVMVWFVTNPIDNDTLGMLKLDPDFELKIKSVRK